MKDNMRFVTKGLSGLNLLREETHSDACKGYSKMWFILMLLVVLVAGCNGNNPALGGGGAGPTVSSTVPAAGASNVAVDAPITATFSKAMDPLTITETTFTVTTGATAIPGTVDTSANGLTATFTPDSDLTADTLYTATITTGVKDVNGNAMAADKVWTFTTGTTLSPTVVSVSPADGALGVATTAIITATFSTAMAPATITTTTFTVTGTTAVTGTVALSADGLTATFTPTVGLTPNTLHIARVTTGVKDVNGNAMAADKVWTFTTGL